MIPIDRSRIANANGREQIDPSSYENIEAGEHGEDDTDPVSLEKVRMGYDPIDELTGQL